ncbi:MAG: hypothetical protein AAB551_01360 [Patescibacteria group bacterium]
MIFRLHYPRFCYKDASGAAPGAAGSHDDEHHEPHEHKFGHGRTEHERAEDYYEHPHEPNGALDKIKAMFRPNGGPDALFEQDAIFANVSQRVRKVLGGLPDAAGMVHTQRERREHGGHGSIWTRDIFSLFRGHGHHDHLRFGDAANQAEFDVNMPGYISAKKIDEYFLASGLSQTEQKRRGKILERMKHAMGDTIVNKRMNHPVFLMAMRTLLQTPISQHTKILDNLFGKEQNLLPDADQKSRALEDVNTNYKTMEETMKEVEHYGGEGFLENLRDVKVKMANAKTALETARANRPTAGGNAVAESYRTEVAELTKEYEKLEEKYKKLADIYQKLKSAQDTFYRRLSFLVPDADPAKSQLRHSERDHYVHLQHDFSFDSVKIDTATDTNPTTFAARADVKKFNKFFRNVNSEDFYIQFRGLKKHVEHDVHAAKKPKKKGEEGADPEHAEHDEGHPQMTENELMYKILYYRATQKRSAGGDLDNASPTLTLKELEDKKIEASRDAFHLINVAKNLGMILNANKLRAERQAKLAQKPGFWQGLVNPSRYPMKDLPKFKTLLERLKFVRLEKLDEKGAVVKEEGGSATMENPFAEVHLKPGMSLAALRHEVDEGRLKKQDVPRMIGYMEAMLEGQDRYQIRYDDITPLADMIMNLRSLQTFHEHNKFLEEVKEDPDKLDEKLAALWKNDLKISEKVNTDARQKLFKMMRDNYKKPDSYKNEIRKLVTQAKEKYITGEFDFGQAKEFLKKHGVPVGILSGLGLLFAAKRMNIGKYLKEKLPKTAGEEAGKVEDAGVLRKAGYQLTRPFRWIGNNLVARPTKFLGRNLIMKPARFVGYTVPKTLLVDPAIKLGKATSNGLASAGNYVVAVPGRVGRKFVSEVKAIGHDFAEAARNFPSGTGGGGGGHAAPAH